MSDRKPGFLLLHVPWGLIGLSKTKAAIPDAQASVDTRATVAPLLFCEDAQRVFLNGRSDTLERFVGIRTRLREPQIVYDLPVPLHGSEPQRLRHESWKSELEFHWAQGVDRPVLQAVSGSEAAHGQAAAGQPAFDFMLAVLARMHDFEAAQSDAREPWDFVLERWLDPEPKSDPTMDVLVRHAREHRARWSDIAEHPRRVLNRQRELVPLSRVQELDTQCMQWLSRQPGNSLVERAGGRQRILALSRFENRNTLENRVFRDLLDRTVSAAREYLVLNADRARGQATRRTMRYALVQQYQRECRRLSFELEEQGVMRAPDIVQPNYVLLHDNRYQHVWTAWQEIIHRERVMDDLWRWQRRSWAEFCKVSLVQALLALGKTHLAAASPVFVRIEHRRGEWLLHDDPLVAVAHEEKRWVAEVLGGDSNDVRDVMKELGASVWLRISDYEGGHFKYLPVWTLHSVRGDLDLAELVESANEALRLFPDRSMLAGGVVLLAAVEQQAEVRLQSAEHVTGIQFGPWYSHLAKALGDLGDELAALIEQALSL